MTKTPIARHFARLRELLSSDLVDKLEHQYKQDQRAYDRESRQRTKQRQERQKAAREDKGHDD